MGVLRHMYSWAMEEGKLKRKDNPASKIDRNLPKKKQGDVVLSLSEARIVWDAAEADRLPVRHARAADASHRLSAGRVGVGATGMD